MELTMGALEYYLVGVNILGFILYGINTLLYRFTADGQVSTYQNGGVYVCGHTKNQNNVFRSLTSSNCRCYRVNPTITVGADEKRVRLNATGSGFTIL